MPESGQEECPGQDLNGAWGQTWRLRHWDPAPGIPLAPGRDIILDRQNLRVLHTVHPQIWLSMWKLTGGGEHAHMENARAPSANHSGEMCAAQNRTASAWEGPAVCVAWHFGYECSVRVGAFVVCGGGAGRVEDGWRKARLGTRRLVWLFRGLHHLHPGRGGGNAVD